MPKISDDRREATIAAVLASLEKGSTISAACGAAGIAPWTLCKWRHADEELEASVQDRLLSQIDVVEGALYKNCLKDQPASIIFFLCNRAPGRWQHVNKIEMSGVVRHGLTVRDFVAEFGSVNAVRDRMGIASTPSLTEN